MTFKLTITTRLLPRIVPTFPFVIGQLALFFLLSFSGCGTSDQHRTSAEQIKLITDRHSNEAEYSCRPTDSRHAGDYIWVLPEPSKSTKTIQVTRYSSLGKSGFERRELILLSQVEPSVNEAGLDFRTGPMTSGSFDTEYDVSSPVTLLTIDAKTMVGRLRVMGYAGNLSVNCAHNK